MAAFRICLMGQSQPLDVDLNLSNLDEMAVEASRTKFLIGHMTKPDEDGVCRGVLIAASRIQCAIEVG